MKHIFIISLATTALSSAGDLSPLSLNPNCHEHHHHQHSSAPIGVMGDHLHPTGEWMASYRYMFMRMGENFDGSHSLSDAKVLGSGYMVSPTDMDMEMHMIGLMYAPSERLTLMAMFQYLDLSMNHVRSDMAVMGMGGPKRFNTSSRGIGDTTLSALFQVSQKSHQTVHAGLGILLPTAEIDKEDVIPGPGKTRLPYPMQLGAGSWGLTPSITINSHHGPWSWGAQASAKIYLNDNDEGYRLGNRGEATIWASRQISEQVGFTVRTAFSTWEDIHGSDRKLLPLPVPTADPDLRGGSQLDLAVGLNLLCPSHAIQLGIEAGVPIWQDLDGPQLGTDWFLTLGTQFSW